MALSKTIKLDNGVDLNYHVIDTVETITSNSTKVLVHGFTSKEFYTKATTRFKLLEEQNKLVEEFTTLSEKENPTKPELKKLGKLQTQINDLADKINTAVNYEDCVLGEIVVELSNTLDLSKASIEKELIKTEQFKLAKIVS